MTGGGVGGKVLNLTVSLLSKQLDHWPLGLCLLVHNPRCFPNCIHLFFFFKIGSMGYFTRCVIFFCSAVNFEQRGVCCRQQGSSSHLSVQIARKLFNSHSVANKIGHSVLTFLPAGMDTDHWPNLTTMHKNRNQLSQHSFTRVNGPCKMEEMQLCEESQGQSYKGVVL